MTNLSAFGLSRSRLTVFVMFSLIVTGMILYSGFPKREDPEITIRTAVVRVEFTGSGPERIEKLIADKVERKIREIPEVDDITTLISADRMKTNVALRDEINDLNPVWQELRDKMEEIARDLPDGARGPFVDTNFGDVTIASIAMTAEGFDYADMEEAAKELQRRLYTVDGVAKVALLGVQDERIWLEIDAERLASIGIQISTLIDDLQNQNVVLPAGNLNAGGTSVLLEASGDFKNVEQIENLLTRVSNSDEFVRLQDLMTVRRGFVSPKEKPVYFDGAPAVVVTVDMQSGYDIQAIGESLRREVRNFENTLPIGFVLNFATFQPDKVTFAVNNAMSNVLQTFVVVFLIVLSLLGLRCGLVIASIVPFSMMFALVGMALLGISLEQISIAAVIISLGLLVDNGVVIVEDILRRVGEGAPREEAARQSGQQFAVPLLVSSLTTIFAFLPFFLLVGNEGEYAFSLGAVVAVTLLGSWFSSLYFLPMIASRFLSADQAPPEDPKAGARTPGRWAQRYQSLLTRGLAMPIVVIAAAYGAVVFSLSLFGAVPQEQFPESDRDQLLIYMELPKGSHISETEESALAITQWLNDRNTNPEVENSIVYVGDGGPRFYLALDPMDQNPAHAFFLINTVDYEGALTLTARARKYLNENHPEGRYKIKRLGMGPSESGIVEIEISGPELNRLMGLATQVEALFAEAPGMIQNENDWGNKIIRVVIDVDQDKARRLGITSESTSQLLNAYFDGFEASIYREEDQSIPIILRASEKNRDSLEDLLSISISGNGEILALEQVATFDALEEFAQIRRKNQVRTIIVSAKSAALTAAELLAEVQPGLEALDLSGGYDYVIEGETASSGEINGKLAAGLPPAFALMLLAIIYQFNSFRRAIIVFMTIPLIIIGVPLGLLLTGEPMSFFGTLGLISLAGIIINNAIVLIDQIDIERKSLAVAEAIKTAAAKRLRPILLTSATTVLGLFPLYLFGGALWSPLAVVMMSGLVVASLLTLLFVPAAYQLMYRNADA